MKDYADYKFDPTNLDDEDIRVLTCVANKPICPFMHSCYQCTVTDGLYNCSTVAANILKAHEDYLIDSILLDQPAN